MSEYEHQEITVVVRMKYLAPVYPTGRTVNGWTFEQLIQDWFFKHSLNSSHATRDSYLLGNSIELMDVQTEGYERKVPSLDRLVSPIHGLIRGGIPTPELKRTFPVHGHELRGAFDWLKKLKRIRDYVTAEREELEKQGALASMGEMQQIEAADQQLRRIGRIIDGGLT